MRISAAIDRLHAAGCNTLAFCIQKFYLRRRRFTLISEADSDFGLFLADLHRREVIADMILRTLEEIHVAEDTGGSELVLILQIAAIAPLEHEHRKRVAALLDTLCHIKLARGVGHFAVSKILTVQPDIEAGIYAFKVQISLRRTLVLLVNEVAQVCAAGIIIRDIRRIRRERILDIRVLVLIVSVVLPNTRNRNRIPGRCVISLLIEEILKIMNALAVLELPVTAEHLNAIRMLTMLNQIIHAYGSRNVIRTIRHGA